MTRTNPYLTQDDSKKVAGWTDPLAQFLRKFGAAMTPRQRREAAKMKPGGEEILAMVVRLARQHGLSVTSVSLADLEAALEGAQEARALLTACSAILTDASDMVLRAEGMAWSGTTLYYSLLSRLATHDPVLQSALQPANAFFARRSQSVKKQRAMERADRKAALAVRDADLAARRAQAVHARIDGGAPSAATSATLSMNGPGAQGGSSTNGTSSANGTSAANGTSTANGVSHA